MLYCTIAITVTLVLRAILFVLFFSLNFLGCKPNLERSAGALRLYIFQAPESTNHLEIDIRGADKTLNTQTSKTSTSGDTVHIVESIPSGVATVTVRALDGTQVLEIKQALVQIGQNTTAELEINLGHVRSPSDAGLPDRQAVHDDASPIDLGTDVEDASAIDSGPVDSGVHEDVGFTPADTGQAAMTYTSAVITASFFQIDAQSLQGNEVHAVGTLDGTFFQNWIASTTGRIGAPPSKLSVDSMTLILNTGASRTSSLDELWSQVTVALKSTSSPYNFADVGYLAITGRPTQLTIPPFTNQSATNNILMSVLDAKFEVTIKGPTMLTAGSPNFGANLTLEMIFVAE